MILAPYLSLRVSYFVFSYNSERITSLTLYANTVQEVKNDRDGYSRYLRIQTGVLDLNPKKIQELQAKKSRKD